jgi:DNA modification methylase
MNGTGITNSGTFREKRWKLYTRNIVSNIIVMESHELSDSQMKWTVFPFGDTWDDISSIQNGEKTKYATQKPIKLLERIVSLYSQEGDLCLDPFAGSGTLGRACKALNREFLLFDINHEGKEVFEETCP